MTSKIKFLFVLLILPLLVCPAFAQITIDGRRPVYDKLTSTYLINVPQSAFGQPYHADVVVDDTIKWIIIGTAPVKTEVDFPIVDAGVTYPMFFSHNGVVTRSTLRFTYLPILTLTGNFNTEYTLGQVQVIMPDEHEVQNYQARIKWAGGSTTYDWINKHNYHLKFVDEDGEKMDVSFFGLRKDNHWRLDAGIVDMLRFRNKAAHGLWADFGTKCYYSDKQPNARSYSRGEHVEVFLNGDYMGFFDMTEFLDRKQMKLKKYDDAVGKFHGMMWKGKEETEQTMFIKSKAINNNLESWGGFDLMYPDFDEVMPTDYSVLANAVDFVSQSDSATFVSQVGEYFDLPVLADYYVFINVLFGVDNTCKNIIWGCYDSAVDKKLTLSVWDLEATVGQHWYDGAGYYHAPEIQPEVDLDQEGHRFSKLWRNRLFMRLKKMPEFYKQVKKRYWELRRTVLRPESLIERYTAIYSNLENCGALDRETERWTGNHDIGDRELDFPGEFEYACDWLVRRIDYLDKHTFACLRGDVDGNELVDIFDVVALIDHLLGSDEWQVDDMNADIDNDGVINVKDLSVLVDEILAQ